MKLFGGLGVPELIIILVVVLIIFGPKNLPKLGSALGKSVKSLREGLGSSKKKDQEVGEETPEVALDDELETKEVAKAVAEAEAEGEDVEDSEAPPVEPAPASEAPKKKVVRKVVKK